jgi:hypothetical protein
MTFDPRNSVAGVLAKDPSPSLPFRGTTFLVQGGVMVTCSHVLQNARRNGAGQVELLFYGQQGITCAEVLVDDSERDLAVLRPLSLPEGVAPLLVAPSGSAENREFESLGYPQTGDIPAQTAQGKTYRVIHNIKGYAFLQLSSFEVAPGFSGGPVLDITSHIVVGIITSGIPGDTDFGKRGRSFSIVTETLQFLYPELKFTSLPPANVDGWLRPSAPPLHNMIRREAELHAVRKLLEPDAQAVIVTIQGAPCVGKTVFAHQLAIELDPLFPGGVIFQNNLGSEFRSPELCNPILKEWSLFDAGERGRDPNTPITPAMVRALFSRQQPLLVVLDDVWDLAAIQPLRNALPQDACLIITTRNKWLAHDLQGEVYFLEVLTAEDALDLIHSRLPDADVNVMPLLVDLAEGLGRQALALNIACGSLLRLRKDRWPAAIQTMVRQVVEGTGFGEIQLPDEYPDPRLASALFTSYQDLKPESQRRFRTLGAFAPDGLFSAEAAAGVYGCTTEEAEDQLTLFVERGLLTQVSDQRWRQHTLLRAYALALLRRAGEQESAREIHAETYSQRISEADDHQEHYRMLDEYPQLRHAFDWAIEHNIELAQDLAVNAANLQAAFYLVRDEYDWACKLVSAYQAGNDPSTLARAQVTLGNALSRLANLPDEDRRARLLEALAAYTEALHFRRPDTAPLDYAMTQNNRGNVLRDLAASPDEDRRARLLEALAAYTEALLHYRPDTAPLDYAAAQNNRGTVLSDLAASPDEDRRARLLEALAAYTEALHFRRPDTAPLDYAMTQANIALLYMDISYFPEENQRKQHGKAITSTVTALSIFLQIGHQPYAQHTAKQLKWISEQIGDSFRDLWLELDLGEIPDWLKNSG